MRHLTTHRHDEPHRHKIIGMTTALVLIDLQNDYFPGGAMELFQPDLAVAQAAVALKTFRTRSLPVFHVQHIAREPDATFFIAGTKGVEIHPAVKPALGEAVVVKHFPNSFRETDLLQGLRAAGVTDIVFAGMMTHMCVDTTVRAACDMGYGCTLLHDACATTALQFAGESADAKQVQVAYLSALQDGFAKVLSTREWCALP
jgi:nicotinamidase-related amidase